VVLILRRRSRGILAAEREVAVVVVSARPRGRLGLGRLHVRSRGEVPLDVDGEVDVGRDFPAGEGLLEPAVARSVGVSDAVRVGIAHPDAAEERLGSGVVEIAAVVVDVASQFVLGLAAGGDVDFSMVVDVLLTFSLGGRVLCFDSSRHGCKCRVQKRQQAQRARECRANHDVKYDVKGEVGEESEESGDEVEVHKYLETRILNFLRALNHYNSETLLDQRCDA
jgi:hypothetical protein